MESNIIIKMDNSGKKTTIINPNVSKLFCIYTAKLSLYAGKRIFSSTVAELS